MTHNHTAPGTQQQTTQLTQIIRHKGLVLGQAPLLVLMGVGAILVLVQAVRLAPAPLLLGPPLIAHIAGLLAGYGVALMLILMSRAPALEHGVGADTLARWHAVGGRAILVLIAIHVVAATQAWVQSLGVPVPLAVFTLLGLPGLATATIGTLLFFGVGVASARAARRRLSYEQWHALHLATYIAAALSFSHELAGPDIAGQRGVQIAWSLLYTYTFFLVLRYRFLAPLQQVFRHRLQVQEVISEADGVVSLVFSGRHLDELKAESGQFFRWRFLTPRTWTSAYPFSLSAPPENNRLRITVKALGEGSRQVQMLGPGTWVLAEGPYGAMTEQRHTQPSVLLVAGGVGITPMRALFETIDVPGERLTLLYRASTAKDVIFQAELDELARRRGARVIYLVGPSSDPSNALTAERLNQLVPDLRHHDVYLCASPGLSRAMREALFGAGLPKRQLHEEVFSF